MQTAEADLSLIKHLLDSRHQRNPNAVTELDPIESKLDNFAQHFRAVRMTV
jgi:hypothetical protein